MFRGRPGGSPLGVGAPAAEKRTLFRGFGRHPIGGTVVTTGSSGAKVWSGPDGTVRAGPVRVGVGSGVVGSGSVSGIVVSGITVSGTVVSGVVVVAVVVLGVVGAVESGASVAAGRVVCVA